MTKQKQLLLFGSTKVAQAIALIQAADAARDMIEDMDRATEAMRAAGPMKTPAKLEVDPPRAHFSTPETPAKTEVLEGREHAEASDDAKTPEKPGPAKARKGNK
jgi:hypothetical protein